MMIVGTDLNGKLIWLEGHRSGQPSESDLKRAISMTTGLPPDQVLIWTGPTDPDLLARPDRIRVTIENGQITSVYSEPEYNIWLHINLSGGDGGNPIGIKNDGTDYFTVDVATRQSSDPTSPVVPITGTFRITVRNQDSSIYDIVLVSLTDGLSTFNYFTTNPPGNCHLSEDDLDEQPIIISSVSYKVKLAKPVRFKVYRSL